jgi:hypothetical protein
MTEESNSVSPVLKADWFDSRRGKEDQRGNGNLMTREKVLEAVKLIQTGEVVSLGMPYDTRMPIAPGRAYALRMPGGPTGGPYGGKSRTIWNDEFIATEIGQIGTQMDALGHLRAAWQPLNRICSKVRRRGDRHALARGYIRGGPRGCARAGGNAPLTRRPL